MRHAKLQKNIIYDAKKNHNGPNQYFNIPHVQELSIGMKVLKNIYTDTHIYTYI